MQLVVKSGEGSRGGQVIGHTSSGAPVYKHGPKASASYEHQDHADAAHAHQAMAQLSSGEQKHHHQWMAGYHAYRADKMATKSLSKSLAHKYVKREMHGDHWVYTYADDSVMHVPSSNTKEPSDKHLVAAAALHLDGQFKQHVLTPGGRAMSTNLVDHKGNKVHGIGEAVLRDFKPSRALNSVEHRDSQGRIEGHDHALSARHLPGNSHNELSSEASIQAASILAEHNAAHTAGKTAKEDKRQAAGVGPAIGQTSSGKDIAGPKSILFDGTKKRDGHKVLMDKLPDWTQQDHDDAANAHSAAARQAFVTGMTRPTLEAHRHAEDTHRDAARHLYQEAAKKVAKALRKAGGEGSRGGRIIGHTKSGKPIYQGSEGGKPRGASKYTEQDHHDAAEAHGKEYDRIRAPSREAEEDPTHEEDEKMGHHASMIEQHQLEERKTKNLGHTDSGQPIKDQHHAAYNNIEVAKNKGSGADPHKDSNAAKVIAAHPNYSPTDHLEAAGAHYNAVDEHATSKDEKSKYEAIGRAHTAARTILKNQANSKTEKAMRATSILNDFLSKATAGTSVSECAELSDSETGETANGSEEGGVFPRKNQKVSAEAADSKDTTFPDEAANIPQDGFTGHTGNEDAFEGSSSDLHTGELPPVKQENWNTQDANSIDGSNRPTAFERSQRNDGPYVYQKGLLSFVEAGADARACASLKNDGFYTGGAPQLHTPMGAKFCKSCRSNMPQFLTACPCCGDGTTVAKSFGMTNDAAHTESALSAPHAESSYRPAGINLED